MAHIRKFSSFLRKNRDAPFSVKKLAWESGVKSAILYGCERWLCNNLRAAERPFLISQKQLLSVRSQTCHDLVQLELGCPGAKASIQETQISFFRKLMSRADYADSPAQYVIDLIRRNDCESGRYLNTLLSERPGSFRKTSLEKLQYKVSHSETSRRATYFEFNPCFEYHPIYKSGVPEWERKAFTQLRLASHRLKIETGRWSRISREQRLCDCGQIQTESHILLSCPITEPARHDFPDLNFSDLRTLMDSEPRGLASYCFKALSAAQTNM